MIRIPNMSITYFFLSFLFIFITGTEQKQALIFDRFTRSLFQLPKNIPNDMECGSWAIACPAETSGEKDFARENSFTKNALFVRELHNIGDKASRVKTDACQDSFKISLAFNVKWRTFQVGFEIFYKLKDVAYFHNENFEDYKSPREIARSMSIIRKTTKAAENDAKELWINKNEKMGFTWIHSTEFRFDFEKKTLTELRYVIGANSRWPVMGERCEDYSLGIEFYKDVEDIYTRRAETTFKNFKIPQTFPCKSNVNCFQIWSILPISHFRFGTSTAPQCSKMVTLPIWKGNRMEYLLKKMDQYLYALYRVVNEPLHIIAGASGEVELPNKRGWKKSTVFLDPDNKIIPVPKIIYKIIKYRVKNCKLNEESCWYSVIIVIHNSPTFTPSDRLCSEKISKEWGWDELVGEVCDSIYVCPRTEEMRLKLFIMPLPVHIKVPLPGAILKLSHFPFSNDGETITHRDIREDINAKIQKFSKEGDELNEDRMIELTQGNDSNLENMELAKEAEEPEQAKNET